MSKILSGIELEVIVSKLMAAKGSLGNNRVNFITLCENYSLGIP